MKAQEVILRTFLEGAKQYMVPLYQRPYQWNKENWEQLWEDLLEIYALPSPRRNHFIGPVVTQQIPMAPEEVNKYALIDGQQRMTTLFILLSVIRSRAEDKLPEDNLAEEIYNTYLINQYQDQEGTGHKKLMPTQKDRSTFESVINGEEPPTDSTRILEAWSYFNKALDQGDNEGNKIDLRELLLCIVSHLDMVSIHLDERDNPYRIFESLNNKGVPLSVTDLIRNYLLMNIPEPDQEQVYNKHWLPMEERLGNRSPEFFWRYLMMDGSLPNQGDTYNVIQEQLNSPTPEEVEEKMKDFSKFSCYFVQIAGLNTDGMDSTILDQVQRLNQWDVNNVAYPFLMKMFDGLSSNKISREELVSVMQMIESFIVRRTVCGVPTNQLRRIFAQMSGQASFKDIVGFTQKHLSQNRWPSDDQFRSAFINFQLYNPSRQNRTRLILTTLERSFGHKESPDLTDDISIEHIMPQTLSPEWEEYLGKNASDIHTEWLHTIGNLTLTGYNPELSNNPFKKKKPLLAESNFALSKSILKVDEWNATAIENRGDELAKRALCIWKRQC